MVRYIGTISVCFMITFLAGCINSNTSSKDYTPSKTDIVNRNNGDIENETRLIEFIYHTIAGENDRIRVVGFTKEGDPILTDITFNGERLEVTRDDTRDEFGSGEIKTFSCEKVVVEGRKYSITGCEGYEIPYFLAEGNNDNLE